jgi:hypothetical protein
VVDVELVVLDILYVPVPKLLVTPAVLAYVLVVALTALLTNVLVLKLNANPLVVAKLDVVALTALLTNVLVLKFNAYVAVPE